jgi:formylglycine-generating enzyme required for sulfatase activity
VRLPAYYLALHPVTNAQYARFLSERRPALKDLEKWVALVGESLAGRWGLDGRSTENFVR